MLDHDHEGTSSGHAHSSLPVVNVGRGHVRSLKIIITQVGSIIYINIINVKYIYNMHVCIILFKFIDYR